MLFGTLSGLNRSYGHDFNLFKHNPQDIISFIDDYINHIFEGPSMKRWIVCMNGVNSYNPIEDKIVKNIRLFMQSLKFPVNDELLDIRLPNMIAPKTTTF
ncbi:hypothetical protein ACVWYG_002022 [Pedobacter sp. UYEF25]